TAKTGVANTSKKVSELDMSNLFPFGPQYQVATGGYVPFNVVYGKQLKEQLIWQAEKLSDASTTQGIYGPKTMEHLILGEVNKRNKAVGYRDESMMGGKIGIV